MVFFLSYTKILGDVPFRLNVRKELAYVHVDKNRLIGMDNAFGTWPIAESTKTWPILGGVSVLKKLGYRCEQPLFYTGVLLSIFFFTCYHYVNSYFGLIEKGVALLIIPNYLIVS